MAKELGERTFSINLAQVVRESIGAIQTVRRSENAKKEADFQAAVSSGMSYEAQIEYRQNQLDEAKTSAFGVDEEQVANLNESITSLKKLKRFNDYRTKYAEALGDMNEGKINAKVYRDRLQTLLGGATDPELQLEIQGNITQADAEVKRYEDTILTNQVKRAQFDGTEKILNSTIKKVKDARSKASLAGNEDEVAAYDATLSSLTSQLTQTKIEDSVNDITVASATRGINASGKLSSLNEEISKADDNTPITIGGKRYDSAREYWTSTRDMYLAGQGSGLFSDYFGELDGEYSSKINGDIARYGYTPSSTIQSINQDFQTMAMKPEFQPFLDRVKNMGSVAVAAAVKTMAETIISRAQYSGDYKTADASLTQLGTQFGVDTQTYRLDLGNKLNVAVNAAINDTGVVPAEASLLPESDFPVPTPSTVPPGAPAAPTIPGAPPATPQSQNLEYITDEVTKRTFVKDLNNPNDTYKEFFGVKPPATAPAAPAPKEGTPPPAPVPPKPTTPVPPVKPTTPAPAPAAPKPTTPPAPSAGAYTIVAGDNLSTLAQKRGTTVSEILKKNPSIKDPNKINVGQTINF